MSTRVAVIDCGTNTIRLLVADCRQGSSAPQLSEVYRDATIVRLGQGVDQTRAFAPDALERTFAATKSYAKVIARTGADRIRFVATSATRDVRNRAEFLTGIHRILGVEPEVISGDQEARYSFRGATMLAPASGAPFLVVDLGGGSTELVLGRSEPEFAYSMDVGSVRLSERFLKSDPPTADEIRAARGAVQEALDAAQSVVPLEQTRSLIGLAGSITTLTAYCLDLDRYNRDQVDGATIGIGEIADRCERMLSMSRADRAMLPFLQAGRVDVIGAGALVWAEVVRRVSTATNGQVQVAITSEHDLLDGLALATAAEVG